jgi:hypothetical protein
MISHKTAKAVAVLAYVYDIVEEMPFHIEQYCNGREQGFALCDFKTAKKVVFSESRNSDSIVVYCGGLMDFSMQGNTPSDKAYYENSHSFKYDEAHKAASFIVDFLNSSEI